jgi:hypothetical protein
MLLRKCQDREWIQRDVVPFKYTLQGVQSGFPAIAKRSMASNRLENLLAFHDFANVYVRLK